MDDAEKEQGFRRTFKMLDLDKDGNIDTKELERFILSQGMSINQEDIQQIIEKIDINQDGKIQFSEFEQIMEKMINNEDEETICRQIFASIDRKSDGTISAEELRYTFFCLGEMLTEEEIRHLIQFASPGKPNVNYDDFLKVFKRSQ